jgi:plasmid maintenance system antidote protein VapI
MKTAITPGEILLEDYLVPMDISNNALARAFGKGWFNLATQHKRFFLHKEVSIIDTLHS